MSKYFLFLGLNLILSITSFAAPSIEINALGVSPKGQYVALEEIGPMPQSAHYVKIRIYNTWKKEFTGQSITVNNNQGNLTLDQLKIKARDLASSQLKSFNISG